MCDRFTEGDAQQLVSTVITSVTGNSIAAYATDIHGGPITRIMKRRVGLMNDVPVYV